MSRFQWTTEHVRLATELWRQGFSAGQIALRLRGVSRNAVIGKLHRLGLTDSDRKTDRATQVRVRRNRKRFYKSNAIPEDWTPPRPPSAPLPQADPKDVARVAFHDLEDHHCRYPVGEPTAGFCGFQRVPGLSYCPTHAARCYRAPEPVGTRRNRVEREELVETG